MRQDGLQRHPWKVNHFPFANLTPVHAKKMVAARKIIAEGCEKCPNNEDVWFHAAELNTTENAKIILGKAVQNVPQSVKIWLKAAELESDVNAKKRVLRKGEF